MWIFRPSKLHWKKYVETIWIVWPSKLHWKKYVETTWIFWTSKLHRKKYVETTWIFRPSKLHWKKYVEITWIFQTAKLRQKQYVETMWIFQSATLHQKSTWKWRGNLSKFGLRRIDVISTSNRRRSDVSVRWEGARRWYKIIHQEDFEFSKETLKSYKTNLIVEIWSSTYRRNINVKSTSIWR